MKKASLTLLLATIFCFIAQAQVSIKPENPQPGQSVEIHWKEGSSPLLHDADAKLIVVNYAYKTPEITEYTLNKMGDQYVAVVPTNSNTLAMCYALKSGESWANNNGEGFMVNMYNAKGKVLPESYAAEALLYRDLGYYTNLNRSAARALSLLEKGIAADPSLERKYLPSYVNATLAAKRGDEGKNAVALILDKVVGDSKAAEADLLVVANAYQRLGMADQANGIREKLRSNFSNGLQIKEDQKKALGAEPELPKREEMLTVFSNKFPPANADEEMEMQYLWMDLCQAYAQEENWTRCENVARRLTIPMRAMFYNSIAWNLAEKKEHLDKAREWAMTATELTRQELESPSVPKSDLQTNSAWKDMRRSNYASYADTYAFTLFQSDMAKKALETQKIAMEYSNRENAEINERYTQYMEANKTPELVPELEIFLAKGEATSAMKDQFLRIYGAEHGKEKALDRMDALHKEALAHEREKLKSGMMNLPASSWSMSNLEGKTVSMESLKGKVVVVDFWATWCGPCKASFPAMQTAVDKFKDDPNVAFVFVNTWERADDKTKNAADFIKSKGYRFNVLIDQDDKVVGSYGVSGIPTKFVLDGQGNVRFKSVGFSGNDDQLVDELSIMIDLAKQ